MLQYWTMRRGHSSLTLQKCFLRVVLGIEVTYLIITQPLVECMRHFL